MFLEMMSSSLKNPISMVKDVSLRNYHIFSWKKHDKKATEFPYTKLPSGVVNHQST